MSASPQGDGSCRAVHGAAFKVSTFPVGRTPPVSDGVAPIDTSVLLNGGPSAPPRRTRDVSDLPDGGRNVVARGRRGEAVVHGAACTVSTFPVGRTPWVSDGVAPIDTSGLLTGGPSAPARRTRDVSDLPDSGGNGVGGGRRGKARRSWRCLHGVDVPGRSDTLGVRRGRAKRHVGAVDRRPIGTSPSDTGRVRPTGFGWQRRRRRATGQGRRSWRGVHGVDVPGRSDTLGVRRDRAKRHVGAVDPRPIGTSPSDTGRVRPTGCGWEWGRRRATGQGASFMALLARCRRSR